MKTVAEMIKALLNINFYIGGLTDAGIEYHYKQMVEAGKIKE